MNFNTWGQPLKTDSAGRVERSAVVICDQDSSRSERKGLQDDSEICFSGWFGVDGTDKKTGGVAGGGRVEDAKVLLGVTNYK